MKKHRLAFVGLIAGLSALTLSSCYYDPYYTTTSYSAGYGSGYGYGGSNFSTSFFVSTGNPRWAYDPYAGCYYDYTRRAYYDPYLYGYYPVGYRPYYVAGAPHPHGWYRGSNYCPPPSRIRDYTIVHYRDRAQSYRSLGRDWSRNVVVSHQVQDHRPAFAGRTYQDRTVDTHVSVFSQRTENFPSRGGSIQRGNDIREGLFTGRSESRGSGFSVQDTRQSFSQPAFGGDRGERSRGEVTGGFPERQMRQEIERPRAQPQPRMERPSAPATRESSPGRGEREGRGRSEIRSLGEG